MPYSHPIGSKEGRFLHERDRLRSCGLPNARLSRKAPLTLAATVMWARRIPHAAREAQGFTRILEFARHVKQLRAKRAELRKPKPDPLRREILDTLERIMFDRADLRRAARRAAKTYCHPEFSVWWKGKKPRLYDGIRVTRGIHFPKRNVAVPATWVLERLGGDGTNIAVRLRRADPRRRLFATPGWVERVARGDIKCPAHWLTKWQRARVEARAFVIRQRRYKREAQNRAMEIDPHAPDTLGWRGWHWQRGVLMSPLRRTPWHEATLKAEQWSDEQAVRGEAGIHARRMPKDWLRVDARWFPEIGRCDVHGIVERFGHYVLGTEGWRSEWAIIRELMAPDTSTALALMQRYPDVKVHIRETGEGRRSVR